MYNLIMTASPGYWNQSPKSFIAGRIFEHTPKFLIERFESLEGEALKELLSLPALFSYEHTNDEDAHIGKVTEFRRKGKEVRIGFEIDNALPAISASQLKQLEWELDIGEWEFNRTHWAVKDADLIYELSKAGFVTATQEANSVFNRTVISRAKQDYAINPSVFRIPESSVEPDLVSVMRPFDPKFDGVQEALRNSCRLLNLRCLDVNEIWNESEIIQNVFSLIYKSKVVICDFSDRNPNVFYEAGIAHTLGRTVVPIVQNPEHIPFDLRHHRYIRYLPNEQGLSELETEVAKRLRSLFGSK